jgi:hypothetical protein
MSFNLQVIKNAIAQRLGHAVFTNVRLSQSVAMPAMQDYANAVIAALKSQFARSRAMGPPYGYTGAMYRGFGQKKLGQFSVGVTQNAPHEKFIRGGTSGPYKGLVGRGTWRGFPAPVVDWAIAKKGSRREGFAVARYIQKHGTSEAFKGAWPHGAGRFEYPEWALKETEDELKELAKVLGIAVVDWATKNERWKRRYVI